MVRKKLKNNVRAATVALLTGYVHFRDILNGLMKDKVYRAEEFKWQMQFKFEMKNMIDVVKRSAYDTGSVRKLDTKELTVDCEVFGNIRPYGFEYLGNCPRLVVTPLTERCQRSLLVAL
jgi:dynein heavy chain